MSKPLLTALAVVLAGAIFPDQAKQIIDQAGALLGNVSITQQQQIGLLVILALVTVANSRR